MTQIQPQQAFTIASTVFVGMVMLQMGLRKRAIRWKTPRRCPSCGRSRGLSQVCENCT
jgi:hypothetical protein